jgi:hypothetical protein
MSRSCSSMTLRRAMWDSSPSSALLGRRRRLRRARRVVGTTTHMDAGMRLSGNHFDCGNADCYIEDLVSFMRSLIVLTGLLRRVDSPLQIRK